MKKTLLLFLAALCLAACKEEPDLPFDPHVSLINPFIGVWNAGGEYWQFKSDGTGGRAAAETGLFPNEFSFFVYAGQDVLTAPSEGSLVILDDSGGADIVVTRYVFSIEGNQAFLNTSSGGSLITLERVSGAPSALNLTNQLIGEWSATWNGLHDNSNKDDKWSLKYRADGTVKTCHLGVRHQFENSFILRGNKLVIFGAMRFSSQPITADLQNTGTGKYHVTETQSSDPAPAEWYYTKVTAAEWL
jgi:hypothetical protein